jgi:casein kinase 1
MRSLLAEEFAIYMNYVRKLGFEEPPDYDFLRELFTKVLKTLGEPEDGVFDWMLLNGGKGWEASNVLRFISSSSCVSCLTILQTPSALLAQAHANISSPHTPHREREHRRDREHGAPRRTSRQIQDNVTPQTPLVHSPSPAHIKSSGRRAGQDRGTSAGYSVQPLAPASRRASQQQREASGGVSGGLTAPHPYAAAPSPPGYRTSANGGYGRHSPNQPGVQLNGSANHINNTNGSESFLYGGQTQNGKPGTNSREGTATGVTGNKTMGTPGRGMAMYDREQMQRVGEHDEEGGHGRGNGFFGAFFCCR